MAKNDYTVLTGSKAASDDDDMLQEKEPVITDRDRPVALGFLARILDEMCGVHANCSIQGNDSVITYDDACTAYKELLLKEYPCA